jgi:hypothetical protein
MGPTIQQLAAAVTTEAAGELAHALARIEHCLGQLTDEQVWWRPAEPQNSIGNLLLHLGGNVRQWIVAGLGSGADIRERPKEFSERGPIPKAELLGRLRGVVDDARQALARLSAEDLLRTRRIQGFDVTGLAAIFNSVPHFRGHTQEIIHITRALLGDAYQFAWQPATREQGA